MSTTTVKSDASKSEATSPRASDVSEDEDAIEASQLDTREERPQNPPRDIRSDLQRIFASNEFKYTGSFYASQSQLSSNAPNPGLCAGKLGLIGLPLSESLAKLLIAGCSQAAFGKGERTIVDTSVRDTWEMDASKVTFTNPAWGTWVDTVVLPSICNIIGVKMKSSKPRAELYKLLVYEEGSHFLLHQDTAKAPGMFATMVILLPSQFSGGAIDLSHSGQRATIDVANDSAFSTHVAAWYTDVFHAVRPVLSGYRLALSYNLIHSTAPSLKPAPADMSGHYLELRQTLTTWKLRGQPMKLFYVMDHMYSANDLRGTSLKGKDAHIVSHLRTLADQLGFHLCLINLELHQQGQGEDYGGYQGGYGSHNNVEMGELNETTLSFTHAVDLDGRPLDLHEDLDLEDETEFFPRALGDDAPDETEYEGYQGNYGGDVDLWYRRTALLIWPEEHHFDIGVNDVGEYAEESLNHNDSEKATEKEQKIAECLIAWSKNNPEEEEVIQAVRSAAIRWGNVDIWLQMCLAARVANNLDLLGPEAIAQDVEQFGFAATSEFLICAIRQNRTDEPRFQLLAALALLANKTSDAILLKWVEEQEEMVFRSLRVANVKGIPRYLAATRKRGYAYLQDVIIPQLASLKPLSTFWLAFTNAFRRDKDRLPLGIEENEGVVRLLVSQEISARDPFPVKATPKHGAGDRTADLEAWIGNIKDAMALGGIALKPYFDNMVASWGMIRVEEKQWMAQNFLPGAMDRLSDIASYSIPPRLPGDASLVPFWMLAVMCYLEYYRGNSSKLLAALRWCGNYEQFKERLVPVIQRLAKESSGSLQEFLTHCYEVPSPFRIDASTKHSVGLLADSCVHSLAEYAPLGRRVGYGHSQTIAPEPDYGITLGLIRVLLRHSLQMVNHPSVNDPPQPKPLDVILWRTSGFSTSLNYLNSCLLPLASACVAELHRLNMDWPSQPLSGFASDTIHRLVKKLGPKPLTALTSAELASLGCGCANCLNVRNFAASNRKILSIRAAQGERSHVENMLSRSQADKWDFKWQTIRDGSPHTLQISKPEIFGAHKLWVQKAKPALDAMKSIGPPPTQAVVLGDRYIDVCSILRIPVAPIVTDPHHAPAGPSFAPPRPTDEQSLIGNAESRALNPPTTVAPGKRRYQDAIGSHASAPMPKRSKPTEIIELSD